MSEVFGSTYASTYDLFYAKKDYAAECNVIERAFADFSAEPVHRVLDLGCGTGGHAIPLAGRGYEVIGMDRSPAMLAAARAKAETAGVAGRVTFISGDVGTMVDTAPCDAVLMMFNVLGYQASPGALGAALGSVRRALRAGGLFLFDVWHAPAVEREPPAQRQSMLEQGDFRLIRLSSGELDQAAEICTVTIQLLRLVGNLVVEETVEFHRVRYFTSETLIAALEGAGMELLRLGSFPDYWREPDAQHWSVFGLARVAQQERP